MCGIPLDCAGRIPERWLSGLAYLHFLDVRHAYASITDQGFNTLKISAELGHPSRCMI